MMNRLIWRSLAFALLVALSPVIAVLALIVLVSQGRPVLFRQARAGEHGSTFTLVKFRTMRDLRDSAGVPLPDELRVTRTGTFLRKSRLDELPSLWNVVKGELAFIGPRPLLPVTIDGLGEAGRRRGLVAPGLTGWAQTNGNTLLTLDQKLALDLWYVEHRDWKLDCLILVRTLWVMVAGEKLRPSSGRVGSKAG
jgi:lipopolysaccharide/colanic/teichoic acid biosynthesis glycosyltransferase